MVHLNVTPVTKEPVDSLLPYLLIFPVQSPAVTAVLKSYVLTTNSKCVSTLCGENKTGLSIVDWLPAFQFVASPAVEAEEVQMLGRGGGGSKRKCQVQLTDTFDQI